MGAVRLSKAAEESTSPARQRERIEWWTDGHRARIVHVAEDLDISGAVSPFDRPGLGEWLTPQRAAEYDVLVTWKLDRLSRSAEDTHRLLRFAEDNSVRVVCVDDGIDTASTMGRVMMQLAAVFAEVERSAIRERVLSSRAKLRTEGRWSGGAPAYGLRAVPREDGPGYTLERDPDAYPHARFMAERVLAGDSLNSIAADLNRRGVLTPQDLRRQQAGRPTRGNRWRTSTVRSVLTSESIRGIMSHEGRPVTDPATGLPVRAGESVVTLEEWREITTRLVDGRQRRRTQTPSMLLGVAFCRGCGSKLYRQGATKSGRRYDYYRCAAVVTAAKGEKSCDAGAIRAEELDAFVEENLLYEIGDVEVTEEVYIPGSDVSDALAEAQAAYEELTALLPSLKSEHARKATRSQLTALDGRIAELSAIPSTPPRWERKGTGRTYAEAWREADVIERRRLLLDGGIRVTAWARPSHLHFYVEVDQLQATVPGYVGPDWINSEV